jgi:hypothetical protein
MIELGTLFYGSLPVLHASGGVLAIGLSFGCDTGRAVQGARIPSALALPAGLNRDDGFMAAYPWDEGGEFVTHNWNPFALIFVFEWLTAGFALRPLRYFVNDTSVLVNLWIWWLALGLTLFLGWTFSNSGGVCVAMLLVVIFSFALSAIVCYYSLLRHEGWAMGARHTKLAAGHDTYNDREGRAWKVPNSVQGLSNRRGGCMHLDVEPEIQAEPHVGMEYERVWGVVVRYAEYCITAPLLFLAVLCLLVVDAPAWLFLTGYWLLVVCNAVGIALHLSFTDPSVSTKDNGRDDWFSFALFAFFPGPW